MDTVTTTPCPMHMAKLAAQKLASAAATMMVGNATVDHSMHNEHKSAVDHSAHKNGGSDHSLHVGMVVSCEFMLQRNIRQFRNE